VWDDRVVPVLVSFTPSMWPAEVKGTSPDGGIDRVWAETMEAVQFGGDGGCPPANHAVEVDERWGIPELVWCDDPDVIEDGDGWGVVEVVPLEVPPPPEVEPVDTIGPLTAAMPDVDAIVVAAAELAVDSTGRRVAEGDAGSWVTPLALAEPERFRRPGTPPIGLRVEVADGAAGAPPRLAGARADEVVVFLGHSNTGIPWNVLWWAAPSADGLRVVDPDGWEIDLDSGSLCPGIDDGDPLDIVTAWAGEIAAGDPSEEQSEAALARACTETDPG
jgi:hypothetical protein